MDHTISCAMAIIIIGICSFLVFFYFHCQELNLSMNGLKRSIIREMIKVSWLQDQKHVRESNSKIFLGTKIFGYNFVFLWPGYFLYFLLATATRLGASSQVARWWLTLKAFRHVTQHHLSKVSHHPDPATATSTMQLLDPNISHEQIFLQ